MDGDNVVYGAGFFQAFLVQTGLAEVAVEFAAFVSDLYPVMVVASLGCGAAPVFCGACVVFGVLLAEAGAGEVGTAGMAAGSFQSLGHSGSLGVATTILSSHSNGVVSCFP